MGSHEAAALIAVLATLELDATTLGGIQDAVHCLQLLSLWAQAFTAEAAALLSRAAANACRLLSRASTLMPSSGVVPSVLTDLVSSAVLLLGRASRGVQHLKTTIALLPCICERRRCSGY